MQLNADAYFLKGSGMLPTHVSVRLTELCRLQGGIITAAQAHSAGASSRQIRYKVENGEWVRVRKGVYHHRAFEFDQRSHLFALTASGAGYASHRYAARLYGLEPFLRATPEVTSRRGLGLRYDSVRLHESTQVRTANIRFVNGLAVSGVARTIMDCCAVVRESWRIQALIDSARAKQLTTPLELHRCLDQHARRGRDGTVRFREALEVMSVEGRIAVGPIAQKAAEALATVGLPRPRHEVRIYDLSSEFVAQVDSYWPCGYVHMYDGFTYHRSRRRATKRDIEQRQRLRALGLVVDEFTSEHVFREVSFLMRTSKESYSLAVRGNGGALRLWSTG